MNESFVIETAVNYLKYVAEQEERGSAAQCGSPEEPALHMLINAPDYINNNLFALLLGPMGTSCRVRHRQWRLICLKKCLNAVS